MPSPIAHALGGFSAGWLVASGALPGLRARPGSIEGVSPSSGSWRDWQWPVVFTLVGVSPDLDLLVGQHHAAWHSLGAALLVFAAALAVLGRGRWRVAAGIGAAYASHVLLDWLAEDSAPPIGVMALWPWSHEYFIAPLNLFRGISRQYGDPGAWTGNARSIAVELAIMVPVTALICWRKGWPGRSGGRDRSACMPPAKGQ